MVIVQNVALTTRIMLVALGLVGSTRVATAEPHSGNRPNVILVLVDDMGFSDVGCYGGEIETPHLDRLANEGLRFTQFYNSGRCCPTRASLMTGRHPHQVGIGHMTEPPERPLGFEGPYQGFLNEDCVTIAQLLQSSGYHTLMTGKWHLGYHRRECWPLQRGFDRFFGGLSGAFNYFKPGGQRGMTLGNDPVETKEGFYATDAFTDYACRFIREARAQDDRPFFLYLAYNAPHWPLNAKWNDYLKYRGKYREGWGAVMANRQAKQRKLGLFETDVQPAAHAGPAWDSLEDGQQDDLDAIMAAYAGCIDSIDQNVGKLREFLEAIGEYDNTLILFLSDNGACQEGGVLGGGSEEMVKHPPLETVDGVRCGLAWASASNTPFRLYKHFVHEGGACTPLIAHWPQGIPASSHGGYVRHYAYLPDVMATCIELSGAKYPTSIPHHEGQSLLPLLRGKDEPIHTEPIYWEHEGNAAVRDGNWKLVKQYKKPWELYHLKRDRTELNDLREQHPEIAERLIEGWEAWATKNQVAFPARFNMYEHLRK